MLKQAIATRSSRKSCVKESRLIYSLSLVSVSSILFILVFLTTYYSKPRFYVHAASNTSSFLSKGGAVYSSVDNESGEQNILVGEEGIYHPADPVNLWIKINERIIVRRLAFFDTRNASHVTVVFNIMYNDSYNMSMVKEGLYSNLYYHDNTTSGCVPLEYWAVSGAKYHRIKNSELWFNHVLRTVSGLPHNLEAPTHVTLSLYPDCTLPSLPIPIKDNKTSQVYTYGVCLHKSIYNMTEPQELVQWVELNLALGVEIMTIYLQYEPESFYTILLPYIKKGVVEVLDWGLKPPFIPEYTKDWGQTGVVNECIYRNMYRVKYLGLYDLDEFFVPQKHQTIPEMIAAIEQEVPKAKKASSYVIYNGFFYKRNDTLPELKTAIKTCPMKWPRYYTYTIRSARPAGQHRFHKLIVKPNAVISAWNHWVNKCMNGYSTEYRVPVDVALTQHYRYPEKKPLTEDFVTSLTISKYFNQTFQGISKHVCDYNKILSKI